jgi:hypothetical protein
MGTEDLCSSELGSEIKSTRSFMESPWLNIPAKLSQQLWLQKYHPGPLFSGPKYFIHSLISVPIMSNAKYNRHFSRPYTVYTLVYWKIDYHASHEKKQNNKVKNTISVPSITCGSAPY